MKGILYFILGISIGYVLRNVFALPTWLEVAIVFALALVLYVADKRFSSRNKN